MNKYILIIAAFCLFATACTAQEKKAIVRFIDSKYGTQTITDDSLAYYKAGDTVHLLKQGRADWSFTGYFEAEPITGDVTSIHAYPKRFLFFRYVKIKKTHFHYADAIIETKEG